ncbi:hypothetical protein PG985_014700 [Apiospora marii]|uniref:Uncharacterized protein n=1 Tax=Apiospora marii TaxID=335849 RepID=A0ABR1R461_9PEZI
MQLSLSSLFAALALASVASAQNGRCIQKGAAACSGQYPKECALSSGTGGSSVTCCLSSVTCTQ